MKANGLRFGVIEQGKGPLVLLLHGFPDTAYSWDVVQPAVAAQGFHVVAPFMRAYAPTDIPADGKYDADTLGRDVAALITALGESSAIVVGHDWGASAAFSVATQSPERVKKLITVGIPHPASVKPTLGLLWLVRHFFTLKLPGAAARARANDFALIDELVARWSPAWKVPPGETRAVKEAFADPGRVEAALGYYRALRVKLPASQRRRVGVPSVAFAGTDDNVDPALFDRAASWYTAGYEVVRVPGGHFMHREHPEPFVKELLRVLGQG